MVTIITGQQGEGKSTLLNKIILYLTSHGVKPGGILTSGIWKNGKRDFISARNVFNNKEIAFCQREFKKGWYPVGNFYLNPAAKEFAMEAAQTENCDIFILDEIGKFELEEKGWYNAVIHILQKKNIPVIFVIRDLFVDEIISKFSFTPEKLIIVKNEKDKPAEQILSSSLTALINP